MEIDAVLEVEAGDPQIAIDFLLANINLSKSRLKDLMNKGGVWRVDLDDNRERIRRAMTDIFVGEQVEIFYDEAMMALKPVKPEILTDFGQYSVWNKPAGMSLHGNDFGDFNSFRRGIELHFKPSRDLYWLSAFDYEASGVVLVAHTRKAAADLTAQFNPDGLGNCVAQYRSEVVGDILVEGEISTIIDDQSADSTFKKIRYDQRPNRSVIDVWLKTARPDQLRKQCAELGFPVVGDDKYGPESDDYEGLRLKLVEISFDCSVSNQNQRFSLLK